MERLTLGAEVLVDGVEQPQLQECVILHLHCLLEVNQEEHPEGIDVLREDVRHLGEVLGGSGEGGKGGDEKEGEGGKGGDEKEGEGG